MKDFDFVIIEHDESDSLTIDFEEKKGVLVWRDEAGSRNCDDVVEAVNQLVKAYYGQG